MMVCFQRAYHHVRELQVLSLETQVPSGKGISVTPHDRVQCRKVLEVKANHLSEGFPLSCV
jgi:hypothetical protein